MIRNLLLATFLCLCITSIQAQNKFFWNAEGEKIPVIEKKNSLCLYFHNAFKADELQIIKHRGLKRVRGTNQIRKHRFIFEFEKDYGLDPYEMAATLGIDMSLVRSAHWGTELNTGMQMWLTHKVVFQLKEGVELSEIASIWAEYSGAEQSESRVGLKQVEINDIQAVLPLANQLFESGKVDWAQPNFAVTVLAQSIQTGTPVTPSDSLYSKQYYLNNTGQNPIELGFWQSGIADWDINAPEAWCETIGSNTIKVCVIDQGVEAHEDLNDDNGGGGSRIVAGYTPDPGLTSGGVPQEDPGAHGQGVAGVIGASHNNIGVAGICPECELMSVCAFTNSGAVDETDATDIGYLADGITWAYTNGADVINNSWVLNTCTSTALFAPIETAIDNAKANGRAGKGSLVVFSAGQEVGPGSAGGNNPYNCVAYPASLSSVIAVGAIDLRGDFPSYANYGPELDIVAPTSRQPGPSAEKENNVAIVDRTVKGYNQAANNATNFDYPNMKYTRYFGGTSVAAAEVSGVAALVLSKNPNLTAAELTNLLLSNTRTSGIGGSANQSGNGMLRADAVLAATPAPGLPVEYLSFTGEAKLQRIELNWETAIEINNDFFLVEKQIDGVFRPIGRVEGFGTTTATQGYSFSDFAPKFGANIYRLRQVDIDGTLDYSNSIEVSMDASNLGMITRMFPMPAKGELNVEIFDMANKDIRTRIMDTRGRLISQQSFEIKLETELLQLNVSSLSAGTYFLRINADGTKQEVRKFVITE
ncbi:MAG: S8/S53 family peptidase [Bacteroidota bacterium]